MSERTNDPSTHVIPRLPSLQFTSVDLHVIDGPDRGTSLRLAPGVTHVGTAAGCQLRLTDATVSRVHCEVRVRADGVRVVDCGSTNGTEVEGVEVHEANLRSGNMLRIGASALRVDFADQPLIVTLSTRESFGSVLGASAEMRRVYSMMEMVAPTDTTVLVQGETGTGKEVVARAIHDASKRSQGPFVAVDCGAIAENLIESELFGHVRGAFSGAVADRRGLFEEAEGGTIFLDEIGELPLVLQPKLLRVLEMREARRVGANTTRKLNVRVIAATNRALAQSVNDSTFREDLYYRLAVCEIALPPLRARREDIPILANEFYARITESTDRLPDAILGSLAGRSWPGNVRELKNFVERSACLGWSQVAGATQPPASPPPVPVLEGLVPVHLSLKAAREVWTAQFESLYVAALLRRTGGNVTKAAEYAGVNRRYLHRLIAEHGIRGARGGEEG
jgi:DNA-binding NtrC family response regulator